MPFDVTTVTPNVSYTATGGQTNFTIPFGFLLNTDLLVTKNSVALALTTNYTVAGAGVTGGGTLTLTSGATAGDVVLIRRSTARGRVSAYTTGGALPASSLETDLDRLTMIVQELEYSLGLINAGTSQVTTGQFAPTWTGYSTPPSGNISWTKIASGANGIVVLSAPSSLFGSANGTAWTISGLPDDIKPSGIRYAVATNNHLVVDTVNVPGLIEWAISATGVMTPYQAVLIGEGAVIYGEIEITRNLPLVTPVVAGWGLGQGWTLTYLL